MYLHFCKKNVQLSTCLLRTKCSFFQNLSMFFIFYLVLFTINYEQLKESSYVTNKLLEEILQLIAMHQKKIFHCDYEL